MPDVELGPVDGGSNNLGAYLATPAGAGPWPGVVAIHEIFGLTDMLRRQADRLAEAGYLTLGPDLFSDGGARRCVVSTMRSLFAGAGKPLADIEAARQHLLADARCSGKVGVIGFCMGGGFALVAATTGFDAASANYGVLPKRPESALAGACPIVGSYGGKDVSLRGAARTLSGALDTLGVINDVTEYPSAGHSFLNDQYFGPSATHRVQRILNLGPDPLAAPQAWARIEDFFATHLGPDSAN
jgi:carboxymethylenebutenolidase